MSEAPIYPTAREVAVVIVAAARLYEDDPILTIEGANAARGRWLAIAALQGAFPETDRAWIASICGLSPGYRSEQAHAEIKQKRSPGRYGARWWREADLETVKAALAAAIAETDAEIRNSIGAPDPEPPESRLRLLNITVDELRGLPPELIEQLSPEAQALARSEFDPDEPPTLADAEPPDFSHLRDDRNRPAITAHIDPPAAPKPSAAAQALADFHDWRVSKTGRGRVIDHRRVGLVDMGDPPPGRSALDQRGAP